MAMTVNELAEHLQELKDAGHGDKEVMFGYDYGDYWHTQVAVGANPGEVARVKYSEYLRMDKLLNNDDEFDEDAPIEGREVILLS